MTDASCGNDIKSERFMAAAGGRADVDDPQTAHMQRLRECEQEAGGTRRSRPPCAVEVQARRRRK